MGSTTSVPRDPTQQLCAHLVKGIRRTVVTVPGGELAVLGADDAFHPLFQRLLSVYDDLHAHERAIARRTGKAARS